MALTQEELTSSYLAETVPFKSSDFSPATIAAWKSSRKIQADQLFLLLLGPSAIEKTSLVEQLNGISGDPYYYVRPFTTRPGRANETEKTSVTDNVFDSMRDKGAFVCVNNLYGYRFGTPLTPIREAQKSGQIPILDFPLESVVKLRHPDYNLVTFYVLPSTLDEWRQRLVTSGRNIGGRHETGLAELNQLHEHSFSHLDVDFYIVNPKDKLAETATTLHETISHLRIA